MTLMGKEKEPRAPLPWDPMLGAIILKSVRESTNQNI